MSKGDTNWNPPANLSWGGPIVNNAKIPAKNTNLGPKLDASPFSEEAQETLRQLEELSMVCFVYALFMLCLRFVYALRSSYMLCAEQDMRTNICAPT